MRIAITALAAFVTIALVPAGPAHAVVGIILNAMGDPLIKPDQVMECPGEAGEGRYVKSWPEGGPWVKGNCVSGLATGTWKTYHRSGELEWKAEVESGKLVGYFKSWYEDGAIRAKGGMAAGAKDGYWSFYFNNGETKAKGHYGAGDQQGCWVTYHDNGRKASKGAYADGKKVGTWYKWNAEGKRSKEKFGGTKTAGGCFFPLF